MSCRPGYSGGLPQHFVLEVFHIVNGSQQLVRSTWSRSPSDLSVSLLQPNTSYILAVHAANERADDGRYVGPGCSSVQSSDGRANKPDAGADGASSAIVAVVAVVLFQEAGHRDAAVGDFVQSGRPVLRLPLPAEAEVGVAEGGVAWCQPVGTKMASPGRTRQVTTSGGSGRPTATSARVAATSARIAAAS